MKEMKHTPGPWIRDVHSGIDCDVRAANGRKVALCWGLASNHATNYKPQYRAECAANARLIAAAPELLEALQELVEDVRYGDPVDVAILGKATAVIAKATKETE